MSRLPAALHQIRVIDVIRKPFFGGHWQVGGTADPHWLVEHGKPVEANYSTTFRIVLSLVICRSSLRSSQVVDDASPTSDNAAIPLQTTDS
jgi:hypothetical protein